MKSLNRIHSLTLVTAIVLFSTNASAAIFGKDDRKDIHQVPQLAGPASSVASAVGSNLISTNPDGTRRIDAVARYSDFVCSDEKYVNQPSMGVCTGFLISDRLLVTAGHCGLATGVLDGSKVDPFCESFSWVFGYAAKADGSVNTDSIPADRIYGCKRTIRAENVQYASGEFGNDFTLIELDRSVSPDLTPMNIARTPVKVGDRVYTIGHPIGLPQKYSGTAYVQRSEKPHYFEVNLDTFSGNSGGPVFNMKNEIVGILVSGHPVDFATDAKAGCKRVNVCDDLGRTCKEKSEFDIKQTSNFIQRIDTVLPYVPTN